MRKLEKRVQAISLHQRRVVTKGRVCVTKSNASELSEGNGRNHKKTGRFFDEKML